MGIDKALDADIMFFCLDLKLSLTAGLNGLPDITRFAQHHCMVTKNPIE